MQKATSIQPKSTNLKNKLTIMETDSRHIPTVLRIRVQDRLVIAVKTVSKSTGLALELHVPAVQKKRYQWKR